MFYQSCTSCFGPSDNKCRGEGSVGISKPRMTTLIQKKRATRPQSLRTLSTLLSKGPLPLRSEKLYRFLWQRNMPESLKRFKKWVKNGLGGKGHQDGEQTRSQGSKTSVREEEGESTQSEDLVDGQMGQATSTSLIPSPKTDTHITEQQPQETCQVLGTEEAVASITADPSRGNEAVAKVLKSTLMNASGIDINLKAADVDDYPFDWKELANREASAPIAQRVEMQDIDVNDIIVLVMGPTGVGKSTFIQAAERAFQGSISKYHTVGHDLNSGTKSINCVSIPIPNTKSKLILVDTPGFDDRERPDSQILTIIADWLKESYSQQKQINGIVYLHRINDIRFDAGVATTLSIFQKLTGGGPVYGRVVLTTSNWDNIAPHELRKHEDKEIELKDGPWKPMLVRTTDAASTSRFDCTTPEMEKETVMKTLWTLVKTVNKTVLLLQKELVDKKLSLPKTTAGRVVFTTEEKIRYQLVQLAGLLQPSQD